jgi:nitrite reductase (cytochrome c-552)
MERYYDEVEHVDFVHALSKTPILKAQHPDYELYMTGVHAERGVSCADCHMPYRSEGGVKFTNHKIMSPLSSVSTSCQVCHRESEDALTKSVVERQERVKELLHLAGNALVRSHMEAEFAWKKGAGEREMKPVLQLIRHAQWRWDWVSASNGVGFHSPDVALRTLATSIQKSQEAHAELVRLLAKKGFTDPMSLPDVSTKEKAQAYLKLPIEQWRKEKQTFLGTKVKEWDEKARQRQGTLEAY